MFPPRTQVHFSSGGVFSVGAPSRQQDSSGVRCCYDFCSSVVSQAFKKWYLYLAYFYLRELAEHTTAAIQWWSRGQTFRHCTFCSCTVGYRSDYKSLNAASADLLALQKVQKIFSLLLKFPTKFFLVFDYLTVLLTRFFVSVILKCVTKFIVGANIKIPTHIIKVLISSKRRKLIQLPAILPRGKFNLYIIIFYLIHIRKGLSAMCPTFKIPLLLKKDKNVIAQLNNTDSFLIRFSLTYFDPIQKKTPFLDLFDLLYYKFSSKKKIFQSDDDSREGRA